MPPIITPRGFYWDESGPPDSEPLLHVDWSSDWSATLYGGENLLPVPFTSEEARSLQTIASDMLLHEQSSTIQLQAGGRFTLAHSKNRIGISYLTKAGGWKRNALSLIDLAQLVEQLYPPNIDVKISQRTGIVLSAPHSPSESKTAMLTKIIASELQVGWLVATGYRDRGDRFIPHPIGRCINVNRPTEFIRSKTGKRLEIETTRARVVFDRYCESLAKAAQTNLPIDFLIELHGYRVRKNGVPGIEMVGSGITETEWKEIARLAKKSERHFQVRLEPFDKIRYSASSAKKIGSLQATITRKALHIELSTAERESSILPETRKFLQEIIKRIVLQ